MTPIQGVTFWILACLAVFGLVIFFLDQWARRHQAKMLAKIALNEKYGLISKIANAGAPSRHASMVKALVKPGEEILKEMTPSEASLWHVAPCVAFEGGELCDAIKKYVIYRQTLDRANVIEELGDIEFYLEATRQNLNITREETLQGNIDKLSVRYPNWEYTNQAAQERKDKDAS